METRIKKHGLETQSHRDHRVTCLCASVFQSLLCLCVSISFLPFKVAVEKVDRCRNTLGIDKRHDVGFARKHQILARNATLLKLLVHLGRITD